MLGQTIDVSWQEPLRELFITSLLFAYKLNTIIQSFYAALVLP